MLLNKETKANHVYVCVCACEREREREREGSSRGSKPHPERKFMVEQHSTTSYKTKKTKFRFVLNSV